MGARSGTAHGEAGKNPITGADMKSTYEEEEEVVMVVVVVVVTVVVGEKGEARDRQPLQQ